MVKSLTECMLPEDAPVSPHVIKLMGYIDNLGRLECPVSLELATDIILQSLPSSYDKFVKSYIKNNLTKTLTELHGMLKTAEQDIKRGKRFEKSCVDKGRGRAVQIWNQDKPVSSYKPKSGPSCVRKCFYCDEYGHWKRDCIKFLEDSQEMKEMYGTSSSGIVLLIQVLHMY